MILKERFTVITGRTRDQGKSMHAGKMSEVYREATTWVAMSADDMTALALVDDQIVRVRTAAGEVEAPVRAGDLPRGLLFLPMGPLANRLIGTRTESTGMPPFKGLEAEVETI
jgi:formylmethanofuran dehydrogenase subunit D